ncbi:hypothetical protein KKG61_00180 [bacterium]|nr:hypothetical protein [bacterium]MBU1598523.1 hypothetical protein [bacterium]MBU2462220.1 hypothetical protein [bacterium]
MEKEEKEILKILESNAKLTSKIKEMERSESAKSELKKGGKNGKRRKGDT